MEFCECNLSQGFASLLIVIDVIGRGKCTLSCANLLCAASYHFIDSPMKQESQAARPLVESLLLPGKTVMDLVLTCPV